MSDFTPGPTTIGWNRDPDGVVTLTLDDPDRAANTIGAAFLDSLALVVDRLEAEAGSLRGVVLTSAKPSFCAGRDLRELLRAGPGGAGAVLDATLRLAGLLRRLETLGKPVVAALAGAALGGGFELALAAHHRIALDAPRTVVGLPQVTLGLMPGAGGVTRTVRLLGLETALREVLIHGPRLSPARARELGLIDSVVATPGELGAAARAFIDTHPAAAQPWDAEGHRIPGGTPADPAFAAGLPAHPALLRRQLAGAPYPAPRNILAAAVEGTQVDLATAGTIEARYFTELATGQPARNMIQGLFFDLRAVHAGAARPQGHAERMAVRVAVLGAGTTGAGIAHACALAGFDVALKDVTRQAAEAGRARVAALLEQAVARGDQDQARARRALERIEPTADAARLAGCEIVIEAGAEDPAHQREALKEAEAVAAPDALLCAHTPGPPVTALAAELARPGDFLGLRFFPPGGRTPLVEILRDEHTHADALARAFDLVRQLGRTPVVVNGAGGSFAARLVGRFLDEGLTMIAEGTDPATVEQAAAQAGYPAGALALADELGPDLPRPARERPGRSAADTVLDRMAGEFARGGRRAGAGFYDYADGRRTGLWPGLRTHFARPDAPPAPFDDLKERLLFAAALEAVCGVEEGGPASAAEANAGSLLGAGFPAWTGGALQYVNGYPGGPSAFVARARQLSARYGERFAPPASLVTGAAAGSA